MSEDGIGVLGPLFVVGATQPRARQQRLLLSALIAAAPSAVSADRLIEGLWHDHRPVDARKALQVIVVRLRNAVAGGDVEVTFDNDGYRLSLESGNIDAVVFDQLCRSELALADDDLVERRRLLEEALLLWRGEPFGDLADEELVRDRATALRLRHDDAVGRLHELRLELGDLEGLIPELTGWAHAHPLDEHAWCRLALSLHRVGRPTEALRTLHVHRREVRASAGVEPTSAVAELETVLLADEAAAPHAPHSGNLVVPTRSIIGRSSEVRSLSQQLSPREVMSIVGAGGIGKTTLALHVASGIRHRYRDGVWVCELAEIAAGHSIVDALASTLGVRQQRGITLLTSITAAFADADALIILDNCEHVRESAAEVMVVLQRECPTMTLLTTSRAPLEVTGERIHTVGPLQVPTGQNDLGSSSAVALFVDRARESGAAIQPGEEAGAIAEICRRLDGVPLAIELAAARARTMSVTEMSIRLDERFRLLTRNHADRPPRQQTLWDAVDWSYQLLDSADQDLFCRLSVFLGGFTIEAANSVACEDDVEDAVWSLVNRSMLTITSGSGRTRYHMLETLRQFGREQLEPAGLDVQTNRAHMRFFVDLAVEAAEGTRGADEGTHERRITDDLANLRAAHQFALSSGDVESGSLLVTGLHEYAQWRQFFELGSWASSVLELDPTGARSPALHAIAGWRLCIAGDFDAARSHAHRGLAAEIAGGTECGWLHDVLAHCAYFQGDVDGGLEAGSAEITRSRALGDPYRLSYVLADSGIHAAVDGQTELARSYAREALELAVKIGNPATMSMARLAQGFACRDDDAPAAIEWLRQAAEMADTVDSAWTSSISRAELALLLALHGDAGEAITLGVEQFSQFRRAGDDARVRGVIRMTIVALHRVLDQQHWADLVVLDAATFDRPHVREPFNDNAIADVMVQIANSLGAVAVDWSRARGRAMDDRSAFELGMHVMEVAASKR